MPDLNHWLTGRATRLGLARVRSAAAGGSRVVLIGGMGRRSVATGSGGGSASLDGTSGVISSASRVSSGGSAGAPRPAGAVLRAHRNDTTAPPLPQQAGQLGGLGAQRYYVRQRGTCASSTGKKLRRSGPPMAGKGLPATPRSQPSCAGSLPAPLWHPS